MRDALKDTEVATLTWIPPGYPGNDPSETRFGFDPEKAKALLAEAGFPNGEGMPEIKFSYNSNNPANQARAEYRSHLADLQTEAEEAERFNDVLRAAKAREEIAVVTEQLLAAARSGNRRRSVASERARLSVTKAIRYAIGKVERVHPSLARLLADRVKTGSSCSYEPDRENPIRWVL